MSLLSEFKAFAMRGNVIDMAVGVVIGTAFGKIVSSLVADVIMPVLGLIISNIDFKQLSWVMRKAEHGDPAIVLNYGVFIQNIFDFVIISFSIFMALKVINNLYKKPDPTPTAPAADVVLLTEIRDLLKSQQPSTSSLEKTEQESSQS